MERSEVGDQRPVASNQKPVGCIEATGEKIKVKRKKEKGKSKNAGIQNYLPIYFVSWRLHGN
jgi:hypothetical protein